MLKLIMLVTTLLLTPGAGWAQKSSTEDPTPKWSTTEITLTAGRDYRNPYTQTGVTATFSGPGGSKTVRGFWDGGNVWKIRFTSTAEGTWTYTTSSPDPGLNNKSGTINSTPPGENRGFLRRDPVNPYTFSWDNGTRYFMWGQTYYDVMRLAMVSNSWKAAVDNSAAYGMNKVRLHVFAQGNYGPSEGDMPQPRAHPFLGTSSGLDHDQPNIPYWRKLDELVSYLASKGMVADLILFNPYGPASAFGTQAQDDRYTRYVLARYAAYTHVIWCLSNEWEKPRLYWDAIGGIVRAEDPWMAQGASLRPLSIHPHTAIDFQFFGSSWPVHAIIQWGVGAGESIGARWGNGGIVANLGHNMPVVNDEYAYIGQRARAELRGAIWGIAVAGGYGSSGDLRLFAGVAPEISGEWRDAPEYGDIQRMIKFFTTRGIEYWKMSSQNSLVTSGREVYVLAEPGRQYVIYAGSGGKFSINIAPGTYAARRYNPRTGAETPLASVTGGGAQSFAMPDSDDWVVVLRQG